MTIVILSGGPNFGDPATSDHARIWAQEYGMSNPVVVDSAYEHTGYLLPSGVTIPAEALLQPGVRLVANPSPQSVDDAAIEAVLAP